MTINIQIWAVTYSYSQVKRKQFLSTTIDYILKESSTEKDGGEEIAEKNLSVK